MKSLLLAVLALCALSAAAALPSHGDAKAMLREMKLKSGRTLKQNTAISQASGGQTATANAVAGPGGAFTQQTATGAGSQVAGVSQTGAKVDACQRGPADSAACQTLTTAGKPCPRGGQKESEPDRAGVCSDIAPDTNFTCPEQAKFGKCDADFIFKGSYCLKSCNRCGATCVDKPPSGGACAADQCNSTAILAGPWCLKTCGRCSAAA